MAQARKVVAVSAAGDGWQVYGKTGTAYPRDAAGVTDEARGYGWSVGWATKGRRTPSFARLDRVEGVEPTATGQRARAALLTARPAMAEAVSP